MRYRLQRHDGTDCSATMVPITVLRMVPIQRYRQLYNKTKGMMDIGISEYIIKCRLEYARKLLDATTLSISEVAEQSGFKHSRNFSTVFKNAMGMSPSDYRKKDSRPS